MAVKNLKVFVIVGIALIVSVSLGFAMLGEEIPSDTSSNDVNQIDTSGSVDDPASPATSDIVGNDTDKPKHHVLVVNDAPTLNP